MTDPAPTTHDVPTLWFDAGVDAACVSAHDRAVLRRLLVASGNPSCLVTSAARTPEDQARVMYDLLERHGVSYARQLWLAPGQHVVDTYVLCGHHASREETIAAMARTIREVGAANVSHHCADPREVGVYDVAPSSLPHPEALVAAAKREMAPGGAIAKVLDPGTHDPAIHLEIRQPRPA